MARKLRVEYPGAINHVMSRGDRREPIFKDDEDPMRFLATLGEACARSVIMCTSIRSEPSYCNRMSRCDPTHGAADHTKAEIARRLRRETTVSWDWIARGLIMGVSDYAAHCVRSILTSA